MTSETPIYRVPFFPISCMARQEKLGIQINSSSIGKVKPKVTSFPRERGGLVNAESRNGAETGPKRRGQEDVEKRVQVNVWDMDFSPPAR